MKAYNFETENKTNSNIIRLMIIHKIKDDFSSENNIHYDINGGIIDETQFKSLEFRGRTVPCDLKK
jgi:hypothetical protein